MVRPPSATNQKTSMAAMVAARSSRGKPWASSTVATRWRRRCAWRCASTSPSPPPSASRRSTTATRSSPGISAPQTCVSSATGSSPLPRSNGSLAVRRLFFITAGGSLQLGFATQFQSFHPRSSSSTEPPDLDLVVPYVESALPLAYGVFYVQLSRDSVLSF